MPLGKTHLNGSPLHLQTPQATNINSKSFVKVRVFRGDWDTLFTVQTVTVHFKMSIILRDLQSLLLLVNNFRVYMHPNPLNPLFYLMGSR